MATHEELKRLFNRPEVAQAVRRLRRKQPKNKGEQEPEKELDEEESHEETLSIKLMMDAGQNLIYARVQEYVKTLKMPLQWLRIDYYYIRELKQWFSADRSTPEGHLIVSHLSKYFGCPKPYIDGKQVSLHFWLEMDFEKGIEVYDDKFNKGVYIEDADEFQETFETDIEDENTDFEQELDEIFQGIVGRPVSVPDLEVSTV